VRAQYLAARAPGGDSDELSPGSDGQGAPRAAGTPARGAGAGGAEALRVLDEARRFKEQVSVTPRGTAARAQRFWDRPSPPPD
jgi:hypothetical protein